MKSPVPEPSPGCLYVVSTPIGNMEDITLRALKVLGGVSLIAAEDTRNSKNLLRHYDISTPCISCFSRNERARIPEILDRLARNESIAIVTDAGTPGLSDPAGLVIAAAIDAGYPVVPLPGASALLAALVVSGLPMDRFLFEGFLPIKKGRQTRLRALTSEARTIVIYESVHRIQRTLRELLEHFGDRRISVCRELTKLYEEIYRGRMSDAVEHFESGTPRGEFVLVVEGATSIREKTE